MNILVIPVQSVSDLITNSSSEVFILETGKTCEEVNTILNTFTSGFRHPEVFSLKDFREWRKKLRSGEIEDDWSYPGTIFSIANGLIIARDNVKGGEILAYTKEYVGGVAVSLGNPSIRLQAHRAINKLLTWGNTNVNIHHIISDKVSVDEFYDTVVRYGDSIYYHVLLPLMPSGRSNKGIEPGVFEYLEEIIQKHDIKNAAFGAHFVEYLKTSKIKTHLYPPESLSKNVILTKDKVQITPSSFNLTPIKVIHV